MRFTYKCPKCDSDAVLEIIGSNLNQHTKIPLTKWSMKNAVLDRYICTDCGYTEEYVQLSPNFKKFAQKNLGSQNRKFDDFV